jgi:DivIVA domain-containing protein
VHVLTPEDIKSRSFLVSLRGYDRDEVHSFLTQVAEDMEGLTRRVSELEERAAAAAAEAEAAAAAAPAEEPAAAANPTDMFAQIGRETQRILESAQAAGDELRRTAAEESESLRTQTKQETDALRARVQQETDELRRTTKAEMEVLRTRTEREAEELRTRTEQEAEELRTRTEQQAEELRTRTEREAEERQRASRAEAENLRQTTQEEAEELRRRTKEETEREVKSARHEATRIIAEGERRREAIEATVAGLAEARDSLADDLRELGRTVERTLREFIPDEEATATVREALAASATAEAAQVEAAPVDAPEAAPVDVPEAAPVDAPEADSSDADQLEARSADEVVESAPGDAEADVPEEPVAEVPVADVPAAEEPAADVPAAEVPVADVPVAEEPAVEEPAAEEPVAEEPAPAARATTTAEDAAPGALTLDLEEELEAAQEESEALADRTTADEDAAAATSDEPAAGSSPPLDPALVEQAQALRAQALAPLHPKVVRKLKRGLQDVQNGMLDKIRRADGRGAADDFMPDEGGIAALTQLTDEFLLNAYTSGVSNGETLAGVEVEVSAPTESLSGDLIAALGETLLGSLRQQLETGLDAEEDLAQLAERIGRVFGETKEAPVEEQSAIALLRCYETGLRAAWVSADGIAERRYALATEPPCLDPRCAENDRIGPVAVEAAFPSGHDVPPVRIGCNCTTVPVIPQSEPAS